MSEVIRLKKWTNDMSGFNDLATTHPDLVKEWADEDLTPEEVTYGSNKKVLLK